jgi:plastocyanin
MGRRIRLLIGSVPLLVLLGLTAAGVVTAGGGCHGTEAIASEASVTTVKIDGCTFAPTITRVPVGAEVKFINDSGATHDVTGRMWEWASGELANGKSYTRRFGAPGIYPYSCSLHPGMAGVVVVGSPAVSLTSDVQAATIAPAAASPVAATSDDASLLPIAAAGGLGLLFGALVAGGIVARRQRTD